MPAGMARIGATAAVMLAALMQALDSTIANVALPYMQGSLSATSEQANWVLTSYIVAAAIMTPTTGILENRLGRRRLFMGAVVGFVVASMLCGAATSLDQMILFRLLQGIFGAPLVPLAQAVLLDSTSAEQRGSAMAIFGLGVMLGPIIGPSLGGWLTESYGWRWVFYVNVPIGALTVLLLWLFLAEPPRQGVQRFDIFGFAMLSLGVGALQMFLDRGEQLDWFSSTEIIVEVTLCVLAFYLFVVHITTRREAFLDVRLFSDRNFVIGQVLIFAIGAILLATLALITPFLERLMNFPVLEAGLVLAPRGMGTMVAMVLVGRLLGRMDGRWLIATGLLLTAFALYEMSLFTADVSRATIIRTGVTQGFGLGFVFVPLSTLTFATLRPELRTQGTSLFSLTRNIGSSIGIAFTTFLLTRLTTTMHAEIAATVTPFSRAVRAEDQFHLATPAGRAALDQLVTLQAATIAYDDNFRLMMIGCLVVLPLLLLMRPQPRAAAAAKPARRLAA
ncbi:DHA2 family efflux MFS transporter permease subunit [uncultured Alsobacter sp.]|uniref:DHA2 family efflux MFS transporter permease subunit n=1 Tax=uncultured Alsobacter sp. TaxID=1748258 RepID=UPI0025D5874D|nr:DHA2 family efflux MFS transporter permease subunit [uncultured Alsobacter sp.]